MHTERTNKTVTLGDIWDVFTGNLWKLILAGIICAAAFWLINWLTFQPKYESRVTLYILKQDSRTDDEEYTSSDFSLALNVVKDCTYLLKCHAVLDKVIEELSLDMEYGELAKSISTSNPEGSRVLEVSVLADTPQKAKQIADCVCENGVDWITNAMGFQQVNLLEHGTLSSQPKNVVGIRVYIFVFLGAVLLVYAITLVYFLLDDKIRTDEDVRNYLGVSVLGHIPDSNGDHHDHYGYYRYSYGYGYGASKSVRKKRHKKRRAARKKEG